MTEHDRVRWSALRRSAESGEIGGPDDGSGVTPPSLTLWQVGLSCDHGAVSFEVEVNEYAELLAALNVLALRHAESFDCMCLALDDRAIATMALAAWRTEYGADPVIEGGP